MNAFRGNGITYHSLANNMIASGGNTGTDLKAVHG